MPSKAGSKTTSSEKPYNLDQNVEAMLCYLPYISLFTSIAIFLMEKKNKFVRFHAAQGFVLALAYTLVSMMLGMTLFLIWLIPLVSMGTFVVWLFMMWKAYNNEEVMLPVLGKIAKDQLAKLK